MLVKSLIVLIGVCVGSLPNLASAHPSKIPHRHIDELQQPSKVPVEQKRVLPGQSGVSVAFGPTLNYATSQPGDLPHELLEIGGGIDLAFGVRVDRYIGFRMNGMLSLHEGEKTASLEGALLSGVTGDALVYILPESRHVEPYGLIGVGGFSLKGAGFLLPMQGFGAQIGLGISVRLNPGTSLAIEGLSRMAYVDNSQERLPSEAHESAVLFLQSASLKVVLDI